LAAFDLPDAVSVAGKRNRTTLPTHALYLLNSPFVVQQAELLAAAVLAEEENAGQRIRALFRRVLQRDPSALELRQAGDLLDASEAMLVRAEPHREPPSARPPRARAWASLCQALLSTSEFRYID
jgi:hypothetical protein